MPMVVDVPLTTTLADLDEILRKLLKQQLARHGFENVEIAFDAPAREWSGKLTGPTVNLFLYDLREAAQGAMMGMAERRENGQATLTPPPLRLEVTYAITACCRRSSRSCIPTSSCRRTRSRDAAPRSARSTRRSAGRWTRRPTSGRP